MASPRKSAQRSGKPHSLAGKETAAAPRIYNLFPLLAGPMTGWERHLERIASMAFNWVFVNPFHYPGFSGSLYAVKDFDRLHPIVQGDSQEKPEDLIRHVTDRSGKLGLNVMVDLVLNHTAKDAVLVEQHPDWFPREADGELRSPRAVDPDDPSKVTIWGDLAEIDYGRSDLRSAQVEYWSALVRRYLALGITGFRCDAAYQVPTEVWQPIIEAARQKTPGCLFAAETLGCTLEQVLDLREAGFDYLFNSAKWWDFRAPWLLQQHELFRVIAPTIAFPESHDTDRLANEVGLSDGAMLERHYRLRYLFAATFSSGVMMPMGYEYGFTKRLNVVDSRPGDWELEAERPRFDLTSFIAGVHAAKAANPVLNREGAQRLATAPHAPLVGLLRIDGSDPRVAEGAAITVINPDQSAEHDIDPGPLLAAAGGRFDSFSDITPGIEARRFVPGSPLTLEPLEVRVFAAAAPSREIRKSSAQSTQRRLEALAASRLAIEAVYPELDGGRHPVKRVVGDVLQVWADIFGDGHEAIDACLLYRPWDERRWREAPMRHIDNDRWSGRFALTRNTHYLYTIEAWRDLFVTWRREVIKKREAGQDLSSELLEGRALVEQSLAAAAPADRQELQEILERAQAADSPGKAAVILLSEELRVTMKSTVQRNSVTRYRHELEVVVDRPAARFAAWYEMFPRSQSDDSSRHGTFDDVIRKLPYVRDMGFDVLYFPPIHPIGPSYRKGRNNSLVAQAGDPGSPYAIGAAEGGHTAIHPELGTIDDFRRLVDAAYQHGLEIALDFAIQCSRDHPWLTEHPEWFDWRPDGTIKFAENPPKKYEDIVNVHFYRNAMPGLWHELLGVVRFWIQQGVKTFRVDNPHTKPLPFWEWLIREVQESHPEVIFLSEAFTRPKMMKKLAKLGFTQSYTYFTWRHHKQELIDYLQELTLQEPREYFRPNLFTNTPDINPPFLQTGGRPAFMIRAVLAATLSSLYGIYSGFELCEATPVPGKEEYLNSEKYEIKAWDWDRPGNIRDFIAQLNRIRKANPALQDHLNLRFYNAWNDNILLYGKFTPVKDNAVLIAVNLDPKHIHEADFEVPLWEFGLPDDATVQVEDLLNGHAFSWHGKIQHVRLDPHSCPCAIWRIVPPGWTAAPI